MSHEILEQKIREKLTALQGSWILQCVMDHKRPEPLDADTVPGYDVVVGKHRLSLRNISTRNKYLSSYDPTNIWAELLVDETAPKILKLYADYLNKRSSESWLAVLEELVLVENKLNKKEKKMLKLHWDLKLSKLNDKNQTNGVVLGKYVLSITIAAGFKPGYKVGCDPSWKPVGDEEIADLRNSDKITTLEASILAYCSVYGNPTPGAKEELEKALVQAEEEWFAMEQEIKHTAGQLQLHWHAGITDNAKHNPVGKEVIRQPLNDSQWFVLGCMDPTALHPKGISVEPAERLLEVSREHLGVIGLLYLDIVEKNLLNPRGMKHYLMLVKEILEMEKTMDQLELTESHLPPSSINPTDDITVKIELRRTQLKNNWLFQIVDAGTPDYAIWSEASVWCRDSLGNGSDLAILCRPKGDRPIGFLKIGGSPFQQFPSAIITNPLTKAFLKMIGCMSTNVLPLEKTSGYVDLLDVVLEQETKMEKSDQADPQSPPSGFTQVDNIILEAEQLQKQDKNDRPTHGAQPTRDDKPHGSVSFDRMHNHWLFEVVDASTPKHEIWPDAVVWCRDSLGYGKELAILYKPQVHDDHGSVTLRLLPRLRYPDAVITNELTSAFLKLDAPLSLGRKYLDKTNEYHVLVEAIIRQDFKIVMAEFESSKIEEKQQSIEQPETMHPVPPAYSYLVVFQDLMAPQSTVLRADWVGSFEVKPLYNLAVYRSPSENFALMFTVDGNVRLDAVEAGAKGSGLAAKLSKLAIGRLGHTTPEWAETTDLLRACFE